MTNVSCSPLPSILPPVVSLICGIVDIALTTTQMLIEQNITVAEKAPIGVIFDLPYGFAYAHLPVIQPQYLYTIVMTWNMCPEHSDDLWSLCPDVLLHGDINVLINAIKSATLGIRYRLPELQPSALTATERVMLRLVAHGYTNDAIAAAAQVKEKTVRNNLTNVYNKLHIADRHAALLYYWGLVLVRID